MTPYDLEWMKIVGPAAGVAVIIVVIFLRAFEKWGVSRDAERAAYLGERKDERETFLRTLTDLEGQHSFEFESYSEGIIALVGLAITMANHCQHGNLEGKITADEIISTGQDAMHKARAATNKQRRGYPTNQ